MGSLGPHIGLSCHHSSCLSQISLKHQCTSTKPNYTAYQTRVNYSVTTMRTSNQFYTPCSWPSHSTSSPDELHSHILCILQILHQQTSICESFYRQNSPRFNTMKVYRPYTEHHTFIVHHMISYHAMWYPIISHHITWQIPGYLKMDLQCLDFDGIHCSVLR